MIPVRSFMVQGFSNYSVPSRRLDLTALYYLQNVGVVYLKGVVL